MLTWIGRIGSILDLLAMLEQFITNVTADLRSWRLEQAAKKAVDEKDPTDLDRLVNRE